MWGEDETTIWRNHIVETPIASPCIHPIVAVYIAIMRIPVIKGGGPTISHIGSWLSLAHIHLGPFHPTSVVVNLFRGFGTRKNARKIQVLESYELFFA